MNVIRLLSLCSLIFSHLMVLTLTTHVQALQMALPPPGSDVAGEVQVIRARYEDTFSDLGTTHHLGYDEMVRANPGVNPWVPRDGTEVLLPTQFVLPKADRKGIVINLPEYRMYYYKDNLLYSYPLGIGREGWGSPIMNTKITGKIKDPAWYPPESIRKEHAADGDPLPKMVPPGPDNPLGPYKFTLAKPGYLIHGSNKLFGIGMRVSHGCFRMLNHNIEQLSSLVPIGTSVEIINQPYKIGVSQQKIYLEAHQPLEESNMDALIEQEARELQALASRYQTEGMQVEIDWDKARSVTLAAEGLPVVVGQIQGGVSGGFVPTAPIAESAPSQMPSSVEGFDAQTHAPIPQGMPQGTTGSYTEQPLSDDSGVIPSVF